MKIKNIEVGKKAIRKRTPTIIKKIGDSFLAFALLLQLHAVAILTDPDYMRILTSYLPEKYTRIATLVCVIIKLISMFTARPNEAPIYPAPPELKTDKDAIKKV